MNAAKPSVEPKGIYSQSQAAQALGVHRTTIARWEKEGAIRFWTRKAGCRKVTTGESILRCWSSTLGLRIKI